MKEGETSNAEHRTPNVQPKRKMKKNRVVSLQGTTHDMDASMSLVLNEGDACVRKFDLEKRLLEFASAVIDLSETLPCSRAGNHVAAQILRSGTSPYPNHGEAQSAESRDDFIHKMSVCLKELRETLRWAHLIRRKNWAQSEATLPFILGEAEELIRIFSASLRTSRQNALSQKRPPSNAARYPSRDAG